MLGKLMKYELKATSRMLLPLYAALLAMTLIMKLFININSEATGYIVSASVAGMLYGIIIVGLLVMTFIMIVQRFYKNLMTDEGYLMFTLPVPVWQQVVSKMLIGLFWSVVCAVVIFLSIMIIGLDAAGVTGLIREIPNMDWSALISEGVLLIGVEFIISMIVGTLASMLQIYVSIALGQLSNKHKIVMAVVAYIAISTVIQMVMTIGSVSFFVGAETTGLGTFFAAMDPIDMLQWMINGLTIINLVLGTAMFFVTTYLLKHKLNLE